MAKEKVTKTFTVGLGEEEKRAFEEVCEEIAIPPSSLVKMFIRQVVRERRVPLDLRVIEKKEEN